MRDVQNALNSQGAITETLAQMERRQDSAVREYLAFIAAMLFNANANTQVQKSTLLGVSVGSHLPVLTAILALSNLEQG